LQAQRNFTEAVECGLQVFDDFGGDLIGRRQQVGVVERVVLEPEDVEIDLVAGDKISMREPPEALGLGALVLGAQICSRRRNRRDRRASSAAPSM